MKNGRPKKANIDEILALKEQGLNNKQIAEQLGCSAKTIGRKLKETKPILSPVQTEDKTYKRKKGQNLLLSPEQTTDKTCLYEGQNPNNNNNKPSQNGQMPTGGKPKPRLPGGKPGWNPYIDWENCDGMPWAPKRKTNTSLLAVGCDYEMLNSAKTYDEVKAAYGF